MVRQLALERLETVVDCRKSVRLLVGLTEGLSAVELLASLLGPKAIHGRVRITEENHHCGPVAELAKAEGLPKLFFGAGFSNAGRRAEP